MSGWLPPDAQIDGLARAGVAILTGYLLSRGLDAGLVENVGVFVLLAITLGWSIFSNRQKQLIKEVAKDPQVDEILVDSAKLANSIPSSKVVQSDAARNL